MAVRESEGPIVVTIPGQHNPGEAKGPCYEEHFRRKEDFQIGERE